MTERTITLDEALLEIEDLQMRLDEAEEGIRAIQRGEVDAVVVSGPEGEQIYTLTGAERTYRILVEAMNEGALVLSSEGFVIYCNRTFAAMLGAQVYEVLGHTIFEFVADADVDHLRAMLQQVPFRTSKSEVELKHNDLVNVPAFISLGSLKTDEGQSVSAVVTDLTEHKQTEAELETYRKHLEELVVERTKELVEANNHLAESEQKVTSILESIGDGFMAYDRDWRLIYLNAEGERQISQLTGRKAKDLLGKVVWNEFPLLSATQIYPEFQRAVAEQTPVKFQQYHQKLDLWFELRAFPSETGLSVYSEDITERKQAEQELAKAREDAERWAARLESFISSMADGVILFDENGNSVMMNDAGKALLGVPEGENYDQWFLYERYTLDGKPIPLEDSASFRALRGEMVKDVRYRAVSPWGRDFIINISASPVRNSEGKVIGATIIFRDVTDLVEYEQQRKELYDKEHHISEMLQQALIPTTIPHNLQNLTIAAKYQPALKEAQVGGDFFDIFELGPNKTGVLIGDVAGKGLRAAIRVAAARYAVRSYAYLDSSPSRVMTLTNDALCKEGPDADNVLTAFFAVVDTLSGTMTYASAGHEPPVICNLREGIEELFVTGIMLGVLPGAQYGEYIRNLHKDDRVVIFTDGITEARHNGAILFEKTGVIEHLKKACDAEPEEIAEALLEAATLHAGGSLQDDVAIVVLGF